MKTQHKLDSVQPDGDYIVLNNWMITTKEAAEQAVQEAVEAGDNGVFAVPYAQAISAPELLSALRECITEDGASEMLQGLGRLRRLKTINEIARAAIAKATGEKPCRAVEESTVEIGPRITGGL